MITERRFRFNLTTISCLPALKKESLGRSKQMLNHIHVAGRPPTDQAGIAAILSADRADIFQETTRVQASRRDAPVICANCNEKSSRHS